MKKILIILLVVLLFLTGGLLGYYFWSRSNEGEETDNSVAFLEGATGVFSSEPTEVQELREKDLVTQEEGHIEYYFQQLNEDEKRAYREMLTGVRAFEQEFTVTNSKEEELERAYHALLRDHPELFWIHNRNEVYHTIYGDSAYCIYSPTYSYTESDAEQIQGVIEQAYQELSWDIPEDADTYEIIKTVYTYVTDETEYVFSDQDQNIASVFCNHTAVCAGYARTMQYLLERMGVFCILVEGDVLNRTDGHAWNIVQIDGEYYYVDATNADQPEFLQGNATTLAEHKTTVFDYLCPFPQDYEQNYFASNEFQIPACTSVDKNFYVMNQSCFDSYDRQTLYDYCCMRIDNDAAVVRFKFSNQEAMDAAYDDLINQNAIQDIAQYYMQVHGLQSVEYHYGTVDDMKSFYFMF